MGNRYWITGVQLGILKAYFKDNKGILEIIDKILDSQYLCEAEKLKRVLQYVITSENR